MDLIQITGLGPFRMYDKEGNVIMEGQLRELVVDEGYRRCIHIKAKEPKKCPHCGAELK